MTKTFSSLVAALAISASLIALTTPVSALDRSGDGRDVGDMSTDANGVVGGGPISSGDMGSGR